MAHMATAVLASIAVEEFRIKSHLWNPYAIVAMGLRREIANRNHKFRTLCPVATTIILSSADKGNYTMAIITTIYPLEPFLSKILSIESRFATIQFVEVANKLL